MRSFGTDLKIPFKTLTKVTLFAVLILMIVQLGPLLSMCFLAFLLAVALEPVISKMQRRMPRSLAIAIVVSAIILSIVAFMILIFPPLYEQVLRIVQKIPSIKNSVLQHFPNSAFLKHIVNQVATLPMPKMESWMPHLLNIGEGAITALTDTVLVLAIMVYFMVDGQRTCQWVMAFMTPENRAKAEQTFTELTPVISAYFVGQAITSILCSVFVYIMLMSLSVPAALILAVLAGIFDILPVIGFFLSVIPAAMFALTVSSETALIVLGLYCVYHAVENYLIIPWVYGNRLRLSGLVVLLAILVGVALAGILGAIVILPVVASYPIIEKIWLSKYVDSEVIATHQEMYFSK